MRCFFSILLLSLNVQGQEVSLPIKYLPESLDAAHLVHVDQNRIASFVAKSLFSIGENFKIKPEVAESYSWSTDGLRLTIVLNKKAIFSDGSKATSSDIKESLERCISKKKSVISVGFEKITGYDDFLSSKSNSISGIKAIKSNIVTINFNEKAPLILDRLSHSACSIVKPSKSGSHDILKGALGTGPFIIKGLTKKEIQLKKNPFYSFSKKTPDSVRFVLTEQLGDTRKLIKWSSLVINDGEELKNNAFNSHRYSQLGTHLLVFNNSNGAFKSLEMRKAVSLAINLRKVIKIMNWDPRRAQEGLIPFGLRGFSKKKSLNAEIQRANTILKKLGFSKKNPLKFNILVAQNARTPLEIKAWSNAFEGAFILPNIIPLSQTELMERRNSGNFEVLRMGKAPGSVDPYLIFVSLKSGGIYNTPRARYPECDKITDEALREIDLDTRHFLYKKAEKCFLKKYVVVPLTSLKRKQALIRKPWKFSRTNQYLLKPYQVIDWVTDE